MIWIVSVVLALSLAINVVVAWYIRRLLINFYAVSNNFESFYMMISNYADHLENVHGLEMFYGDETLMALIDHTKFVAENTRTIEDFYSFLGEWEPEEYETEEDTEEED
jgi:hypothetical protein